MSKVAGNNQNKRIDVLIREALKSQAENIAVSDKVKEKIDKKIGNECMKKKAEI